MPFEGTADVMERRDYGSAVLLRFACAGLEEVRPGRFLHLFCGEERGRILRRPFSICGWNEAEKMVDVLVKGKGGGSRWLASRRVGDSVELMGPLGNGFRVEGGCTHLLVAGGLGLAPLRFLAFVLLDKGERVKLVWGMEWEGEYGDLPSDLAGKMDVEVALRRGTRGKGNGRDAVALMSRCLDEEEWERVYVCGPRPMLRKAVEVLKGKPPGTCQVALEERMACGIGACRGCVVPSSKGDGTYLTVCTDGPVFDVGDLNWKDVGVGPGD
jgi:dihydroorotate dehydrogenase electron transfer subunit